jgi:tRNA threonylcarbamoyladenosine biosynthesis protein TsaB
LCYALAIPLLSVGTLDIMAQQMREMTLDDVWLCPMIDARRMEVYCALYNKEARLTEVEARVIDEHSFDDSFAERRVVFAGNGADKCRSVLPDTSAVFLPGVFPSARLLGSLATDKLERNQVEDLLRFEPFYLKDFKAKLPTNIIAQSVNKPA